MEASEEKISIVTIKLNKYEAQYLKTLCKDSAWTDEIEKLKKDLWLVLDEAGVETI